MKPSDFKRTFIMTLPVMTGYIVLGMGFGILLYTKGYGIFWSLAMSAFIYAGSLQYVVIDLISGGASLITAALTSLMVNARHLFYGISMVDCYNYKGRPLKRLYSIFALTDETYSIVCTERGDLTDGDKRKEFYFLVSLLNHIYWVSGSLLGSLVGSFLKFDTKGIDFALTALFVTIFVEQWLSTKDHRASVIGITASLLCLVIFGPDSFLIPAMIVISAALCFMKLKARDNDDT